MKLLSPIRFALSATLAALLAAGCGATDGTGAAASAQLVPSTGAAPRADGDHRRGPPDPARLAALLDRDHDGRVQVSELPERARERLAGADADRDGVLSVPELTAHHAQMQAQRFARIDADGDGAVTAAEVDPARWAHLQAADADHDGRVTRDELQAAHASGALHGPGRGHFGSGRRGPPDPARLVEHLDRDGNGSLELAELPPRMSGRLAEADVNHDGSLSVEELRGHLAQHRPGPDAPDAPDGRAD